VQSAIVHAVRQRLPDHLPSDPVARGQIIERIYNDVARGITRTPGGGWPWSNSSSITYDERSASPRRDYGEGLVTPNQPARGSATPPAPNPALTAAPARMLQQHGAVIRPAAQESGIPAQVIAAVIAPESGGDAGIASPTSPASGRQSFGLMQIEPPTFAEVARRLGEPGDIRDPRANVRVGSAYLAQLLQQYQGNYTLALAAYNWGQRHVDRILTQVSAGAPRSELLARMPASTQAYLATIGNSLGGWDASGRSFIGLTGQQPTPNQQPGDVSRNVAQTSPSPEHAAQMEGLLNQMERTARLHILSITDFPSRQRAKDAILEEAERTLRREWSPYAQWGVAALRARLNSIR
jgi:soluble lytic murein transglycosylase